MCENLRIDASQSIFTAFARSAERNADRVALVADGGRGDRVTYSRILSQTTTLGSILAESLPDHEQEIGLLSENRPEWAVAYLAILASGRTVVPIDANLKPNEIAYIIDHADLKTIFTSGRFESQLTGMASGLKVYSFAPDSINSCDKLTPSGKPTLPDQINDCAVLIYTSGTTGKPKAVELTHRNILSNLEAIPDIINVLVEDVFLSVLPLHHTFEATCGFLLPLVSGATIVYARSLKSREIAEDISNNGVTVLVAVPLIFEKMYHSVRRAISAVPAPRRAIFTLLYGISDLGWKLRLHLGRSFFRRLRNKTGLNSIRMFVSGGAALPTEVSSFFNLLGFTLLQGYGLTETSPVISANRPDDVRFGSVGLPLSNVEVRIENPTPEGIGEILARGHNVTRGYRGNPDETAKLLKDGWLHTGDLGCMKDGQLYITGRKKNVIVSAAGKNIYPEEIEERLFASLLVAEAVIFGRQKEARQGEEVRCILVPDLEQFQIEHGVDPARPDMNVIRQALQDLINQVNSEMASFKRIVGFEVQLQELEKTSSKKIKRFVYH